MQNGFIESFNGRLRDECLNEHLFAGRRHARAVIERWRQDYNAFRPHSAHDGLTPEAVRLNHATGRLRNPTARPTGRSRRRSKSAMEALDSHNERGTLKGSRSSRPAPCVGFPVA